MFSKHPLQRRSKAPHLSGTEPCACDFRSPNESPSEALQVQNTALGCNFPWLTVQFSECTLQCSGWAACIHMQFLCFRVQNWVSSSAIKMQLCGAKMQAFECRNATCLTTHNVPLSSTKTPRPREITCIHQCIGTQSGVAQARKQTNNNPKSVQNQDNE